MSYIKEDKNNLKFLIIIKINTTEFLNEAKSQITFSY